MKKILLPTLFMFGASIASAQIPTLTATSNPIVGDSHLVYHTDSFSVGASGASVTWNFSTLPINSTDTALYAACSASPHCSSFPGTSIYEHQPGNTTEIYVHTTSSAMSVNGAFSTGVISYSNYEDLLRYPFTFGSSFTDTFSAAFTSGGTNFYRSGTVTVTADAYGTLILPADTFTNSLRIYKVENYTDSVIGVATFAHYMSDDYTWYVPGVRAEVLNQTQFTLDGTTFGKVAYFTNLVPSKLGVPVITESALQLYPNPAGEELSIRFSQAASEQISITLFDLAGREVAPIAASAFNAGEHVINFPVRTIAKGMYVLKMQSATQSLTRKVVIN